MTQNEAVLIGSMLQDDLEDLAKRYGLFVYSFIGFIGQPGTGMFPVCIYNAPPPSAETHPYGLLCKAAFHKSVEVLKEATRLESFYETANDTVRKDDR